MKITCASCNETVTPNAAGLCSCGADLREQITNEGEKQKEKEKKAEERREKKRQKAEENRPENVEKRKKEQEREIKRQQREKKAKILEICTPIAIYVLCLLDYLLFNILFTGNTPWWLTAILIGMPVGLTFIAAGIKYSAEFEFSVYTIVCGIIYTMAAAIIVANGFWGFVGYLLLFAIINAAFAIPLHLLGIVIEENVLDTSKARVVSNVIPCMAALIICIVGILGLIGIRIPTFTFPQAQDRWTLVQSGNEIRGTWEGSAEWDLTELLQPFLEGESLEFLQSKADQIIRMNLLVNVTMENHHDPERIGIVFAFDFNNYIDALSTLFPEYFTEALRREFIESLALDRNNVIIIEDTVSVSELNQAGQVSINQRGNRIQLIDETFGGTAVVILERTEEERTFIIGGFGEAGVVFFDKGFYSDGWRFMEVSMGFTRQTPWSDGSAYIRGLRSGLGDGDFNTHNIISFLGTNTAAAVAASYNGGGRNDWFLGNNREMELLFENLVGNRSARNRARNVPGFERLEHRFLGIIFRDPVTHVWTSEQESATRAYKLDLIRRRILPDGITSSTEIVQHRLLWMTVDPVRATRPIRKF